MVSVPLAVVHGRDGGEQRFHIAVAVRQGHERLFVWTPSRGPFRGWTEGQITGPAQAAEVEVLRHAEPQRRKGSVEDALAPPVRAGVVEG